MYYLTFSVTLVWFLFFLGLVVTCKLASSFIKNCRHRSTMCVCVCVYVLSMIGCCGRWRPRVYMNMQMSFIRFSRKKRQTMRLLLFFRRRRYLPWVWLKCCFCCSTCRLLEWALKVGNNWLMTAGQKWRTTKVLWCSISKTDKQRVNAFLDLMTAWLLDQCVKLEHRVEGMVLRVGGSERARESESFRAEVTWL